HDLEPTLFVSGLEQLVVADDLASKSLIVTTPQESLYEAVKKMDMAGVRQLPVVDPQDPKRLLGIITRKDVVAAYNREMVKRGLQ
ncbi:MAG: chloride channel protein, partial [Aquificota bacterium]